MTTGERRIRVDLPDAATVVAQDEAEHRPNWLRRNLGRVVVVVLVVLAGVLYENSRINPPPSPPNAATTQQLQDLRRDLDQYLAGRGGLRDQQYAKTVYTLCVLAQDANETDILNDPDYDCTALLQMPPPSVTASMPPTTAPSSISRSSISAAPTATASARPSSVPRSTQTVAATPTPTPSKPQPTPSATTPPPLVPGVLCALPTLPIITVCPKGTP